MRMVAVSQFIRRNGTRAACALSDVLARDFNMNAARMKWQAHLANGNKAGTGKIQKYIIHDFLSGADGRAQMQNSLPAYVGFPTVLRMPRNGYASFAIRWEKCQILI
jgi:hypothetical protein